MYKVNMKYPTKPPIPLMMSEPVYAGERIVESKSRARSRGGMRAKFRSQTSINAASRSSQRPFLGSGGTLNVRNLADGQRRNKPSQTRRLEIKIHWSTIRRNGSCKTKTWHGKSESLQTSQEGEKRPHHRLRLPTLQ